MLDVPVRYVVEVRNVGRWPNEWIGQMVRWAGMAGRRAGMAGRRAWMADGLTRLGFFG